MQYWIESGVVIDIGGEECALTVKNERTKLVYSTEQAIPRSEKPKQAAEQSASVTAPNKVLVKLDRKGRGGKSVTVIEGLPLSQREKETLLKQLKARLGTGGALKEGSLEIQGDHCALIMQHLQVMGYQPKRSGG